MDINSVVVVLFELMKDEEARKEVYARLLEECDEYDLEDVETGVDHAFDEVYADFDSEEEEEEFEEDEDYEDDSDESDEWDLGGESEDDAEDK